MNKNWTYKTFGDVGSFLRGKSIQKADFVDKGLPCIHYGQIHTKFGISVDKHLSEIPKEIYNKSIIASPGDVIIAITSEDLEGSCKSTAWLGDYDVAVSAHAAVYKHNLNPKFVVYYLRSNSFFIEKEKYARGFKVMEIKPTDIAKIPIPIPSAEVQQSIVAEFDRINELITLKKKQLIDLDFLSKSIFYDMFGDPLINDKKWETKKYGDCFTIGSGGTPSKSNSLYWDNGNIPWIGSNMCQNCVITETDGKYITIEGLNNSSAKILEPGTVLVALVGATIGKVALLKTSTSTNQNIAFIKANESKSFCPEYVFYHLINQHDEFMMIGNGDFKMASQAFIKSLSIMTPPISLQQSFANCISSIEQLKQEITSSITDLETLFASRMQYWFD